MIICQICNKRIKNWRGMISHLTVHKMKVNEYCEKFNEIAKISSNLDISPEAQRERAINHHKKIKENNDSYDYLKVKHPGQSERLKRLWKQEEYRNKKSEQAKLQHDNGFTDYLKDKWIAKKLPYKDYIMKSSWEVILAEWLDKNNIIYRYEPFPIKYIMNNKNRKYYPDFYIKKLNLILEVKPKFKLENMDVILKRKFTLENRL